MSTNKKIILGALIVTILIVIAGFAYILTHKKTTSGATNPDGTPFGSAGDAALRPTQTTSPDTNAIDTQIKSVNNLREITAEAVSGSVFIPKTSTSSPQTLAFMERSTGNIFAADLSANTITRISNTTIPKIAVINWGTSGTTAALQSLSDQTIETETIRETPQASSSVVTIAESQLLPDILSIAVSPKEDKVFYLVHGALGGEGYVADINGDNAKRVFSFPTDEWNVSWGDENTVYLTTKASNDASGYLYSIDLKANAPSLLLADVPGLETLVSPDGTKIFYSSITGTTVKTSVYDVKNAVSVGLRIQTIASKCAWTSDDGMIYCGVPRAWSSNAPDDWFKGLVSYNDDLYSVSLDDGYVSKVMSLNAVNNAGIDLINPTVSADGTSIIFMNKKDLSLWEADINQ